MLYPVSLLLLLTMAASLPKLVVPNHQDLTIKTRQTFNNVRSNVQTLYLHGAHQRTESVAEKGPGPAYQFIGIKRCDQKIAYNLNDAAKTYVQFPIEDWAERAKRARPIAQGEPTGADVNVTITAVETGEHKQFGSYTARRIHTTTRVEPGAGAVTPARVEEVDGWYIDLPGLSCEERSGNAIGFLTSTLHPFGTPARWDRFHIRREGSGKLGYPVEETRTNTEAGHTSVSKTELLEISEAPLSPSLFQVPAGYRPALHNSWGGYDMSKPDTLSNRLGQYWEEAKLSVKRLLR